MVVVGLGKSGRAAMELCLSEGARVRAVDERAEQDFAEAALWRAKGVELAFGPLTPERWKDADALVVSPGVPLSHGAFAAVGVPLFGEVELAMRFLPQGGGPVMGITGTNGKSTTTALTGELFRQTGKQVFVGGNLGRPLAEACGQRHEVHVVELSSFQLEGIVEARFNGAAILNLTPDHLDRYPSQKMYAEAKARIFLNQARGDFAVVNVGDAAVMKLVERAQVPVYGFGEGTSPLLAGHAFPLPLGEGKGEGRQFQLDFGAHERFVVKNRALRGAHNLENAMAAALLARLSGVSAKEIQTGLDAYPGLPHRLESVRILDGVEWINDSKATNVDSSLVALAAIDAPLWLIAGGKGKGAPYTPLVESARGKVRGVLTIGADAAAIEAAFRAFPVHACGTLQTAVQRARELAKSGEVVLLSPACASYDQFDHFEHRGDTFKALVEGLS
ncbi:MAG: UDP-N-acetylmuramoyl-L-alanine--D-glutamate ligase [Myxococcota bacterium]